MITIDDLQIEYLRLLEFQDFDLTQLDYAIVERHAQTMDSWAGISNSLITIFDHARREHVYQSVNHTTIFGAQCCGDLDLQIHPDDMLSVMRNGVSSMRHFFIGNKNAKNHKLVREYRVAFNSVYKRITEQIQVLETDAKGNIWLAMCVMDISSNQLPPFVVTSKLINTLTGDVITPVDGLSGDKPLISAREVEVLRLIDRGMLSKEIADMLSISVHTVNTHRQRILEKLQVGTSIEAIRYAAALGLLGD